MFQEPGKNNFKTKVFFSQKNSITINLKQLQELITLLIKKGWLMKKYIIIIISLVFIVSCGNVQNVNLTLKKSHSKVLDDQYAATRGMILLNKIDDNLIWFSRKGWALVLDKNFNVLDKIKLSQGKGPEEYINLTEMFILKDNLVYLYDHRLSRFVVLKYKDEKLKKYDTINLNFSSALGMEYRNGIFAVNNFKSEGKNINAKLSFIDRDLNLLKDITIADFKMSSRKDLMNKVGWPIFHKNRVYYVSIGDGNTRVFNYKTQKEINSFYNKDKKMKIIYDHQDANVITPTIIKDKYVFIPYNPHTDKDLKTPGMYYELFDLEGNFVGDGFIKFGLKKIPENLMEKYTINISRNGLYFYNKETNNFTKFDYVINKNN